MGIFAEWHPLFFNLVKSLAGSESNGVTKMAIFIQGLMDERIQDPSKAPAQGNDFLAHFLEYHKENPERFGRSVVLESCIDNIIPGSDTTGSALSAIAYYLCKSPIALALLWREIDDHDALHGPSSLFSLKEVRSMPYLQAVVKESLRVNPAIAMPLARVVPKEGAHFSGHFFRSGVSDFF